VIAGVGAVVQRAEPDEAVEAIELMARSVRRAADDDGAGSLIERAGLILVPEGMWGYQDPAALVAERCHIADAHTVFAAVGILQQSLFDRAATAIASGEADVVVVVGGEARHRARMAGKAGIDAAETTQDEAIRPDTRLEPADDILHDLEIHRGLALPAAQYAVMDSALRAVEGLTMAEHRADLAQLWAAFGRVAAANPWAWDTTAPSAGEILDQRSVATPYTRLLCSQWNVDQAAAIVFASGDAARQAGIAEDRLVYPRAGVVSNHMVPLIERPALGHAASIDHVGWAIEELSGIAPASASMHDLYSCFPAAVRMQARQLEVPLDPAPTVSGGMTFGGGPLNNAVLMALVRTVERLRDEGGTAYVSSISGMITKYGAGLFGSDPGDRPYAAVDVADRVAASTRAVATVDEHHGPATVLGSTVTTGPSGRQAVAVVETDDGLRTVVTSSEKSVIDAFEADDHVGRFVTVDGTGLGGGTEWAG
jgi:acetyl-CoA C-acetyltransferase